MLINANWPAPSSVIGFTTTREGGVSLSPYHSLNLAAHVGDSLDDVEQNRRRLRAALSKLPQPPQQIEIPSNAGELTEEALAADPCWLNQVHGDAVAILDAQAPTSPPTADASYTQTPGQICVVMSADCLPVLICNRQGTEVAAIHSGWRSCLAGILEKTVACFQSPPSELLAWLGPAISQDFYEVGPEFYEAFVNKDPELAQAFKPGKGEKFQADLYQLGTITLQKVGVKAIYGGEFCTFKDSKRLFSSRRDGGITGRMATLIYTGVPA